MIGKDTAAQVIKKFRTNDLLTIIRIEGLEIRNRHPWQAGFEDAYVYPVIYLPKDLPIAEFRTRVAHCLGHHFVHVDSSQVWLRGFDWVWAAKQERQAEEFAAWLTMPESDDPSEGVLPVADVARMHRVTEELVRVRRGGYRLL